MDEVARAFELGAIQGVVPVAGGLSNDMWQVTTDSGEFAVKVMRANADSPAFQINVEAAFLVEQAAFARGVPCPEPVCLPDGRCLARVQGNWVRAHRWVHGTPPVPKEHSRDAASLVAAIHAGAPTTVVSLDDEPWDAAGWGSLADQSGMPSDLAASLRVAAPSLADLEGDTSATGKLVVHVLSHGDLDPKNTLLVDGILVAVDWDAACARPQVREAVSVALDWTTSPPEFRAAVDAYTEASGVSIPQSLGFSEGGSLLSEAGSSTTQHTVQRQTKDAHEIGQALQKITALSTDLPEYLTALT